MVVPDRSTLRPNGPRARELGLSRYDLVLAVVPVAFLLALLVGGVVGVPTRVAVTTAAAVAALALIDGLFLNPPRPPVGDDPV